MTAAWVNHNLQAGTGEPQLVDTAEKRRAISAVNLAFLVAPAVTPNINKDREWRAEAGFGYPGLSLDVIIGVPLKTFSLNSQTIAVIRDIHVPLQIFNLQAINPNIHAVTPTIENANQIDLTPPFENVDQTRYLFNNFAVLQKLLQESKTGQFKTTDGKTVLFRDGIIIDIY